MKRPRAQGFTLVEVLVSLLLCALLTVSVAAAVATAARASALAENQRDAIPLLQHLYTTYRLDPQQEAPALPEGWRGFAGPTELLALAGDQIIWEGLAVELRRTDLHMEPVVLQMYVFPGPEKK